MASAASSLCVIVFIVDLEQVVARWEWEAKVSDNNLFSVTIRKRLSCRPKIFAKLQICYKFTQLYVAKG